jgi:hypothetical protein
MSSTRSDGRIGAGYPAGIGLLSTAYGPLTRGGRRVCFVPSQSIDSKWTKMASRKRRCEQCRTWFVLNAHGRPRRFCRPACRKAAARKRDAGYLGRFFKPKTRCGYCRQPLPKDRTQRRRYCTHSCAQMAYLRRKLNDRLPMQNLIADIKASQRRAKIERQVDEALSDTWFLGE